MLSWIVLGEPSRRGVERLSRRHAHRLRRGLRGGWTIRQAPVVRGGGGDTRVDGGGGGGAPRLARPPRLENVERSLVVRRALGFWDATRRWRRRLEHRGGGGTDRRMAVGAERARGALRVHSPVARVTRRVVAGSRGVPNRASGGLHRQTPEGGPGDDRHRAGGRASTPERDRRLGGRAIRLLRRLGVESFERHLLGGRRRIDFARGGGRLVPPAPREVLVVPSRERVRGCGDVLLGHGAVIHLAELEQEREQRLGVPFRARHRVIVESRDSQRGRGGDERRGANRRRGRVRADAVEGEIQLHQVRCAVESADAAHAVVSRQQPRQARQPQVGYLLEAVPVEAQFSERGVRPAGVPRAGRRASGRRRPRSKALGQARDLVLGRVERAEPRAQFEAVQGDRSRPGDVEAEERGEPGGADERRDAARAQRVPPEAQRRQSGQSAARRRGERRDGGGVKTARARGERLEPRRGVAKPLERLQGISVERQGREVREPHVREAAHDVTPREESLQARRAVRPAQRRQRVVVEAEAAEVRAQPRERQDVPYVLHREIERLRGGGR